MDGFINSALNIVDTVDARLRENHSTSEESKKNPGEAEIVKNLVSLLLLSGLLPREIAVVTPYAAQVELISSLIPSNISCRSVDGYQGGEAEVVIVSMVRSNANRNVGFVADNR